MRNGSVGRSALATLGTITKDLIPDINAQELQTIIAAPTATDQECVNFLEDRLSFYKNRITTVPQQSFTHQTSERGVTRTEHVNNTNPTVPRPSNAPATTQTPPFQLPRRSERDTAPLPSYTEPASRTVATTLTVQKRVPKRTQTISPSEQSKKRRTQSGSPTTLPSTSELISGLEDEVFNVIEALQNVVEALQNMSRPQKFPDMLPDVASITPKTPDGVPLIQRYLGNMSSLTDAMCFCQDAVEKSEETSGNLRISAAIWKIMYIDWYVLVEGYL